MLYTYILIPSFKQINYSYTRGYIYRLVPKNNGFPREFRTNLGADKSLFLTKGKGLFRSDVKSNY